MPFRSVPRLVLAIAALVAALALAACGSTGSGASTPSAAASEAAPSVEASSAAASEAASGAAGGGGDAVTIQNFAFGPASISVAAGSTVTWTNMDSASHTVTADDGSFDSSSLATGSTFSQTFDTAGTFAYHCKIHPNMKATVEVK